ncbi:cytochrome c3 family protein, partial [candidate division KSB1 bacterium]
NAVSFPNPHREYNFNHESHMSGMGEEYCMTCHPGIESVEYATAANMPSMKLCAGCHNNVEQPQDCESCHTELPTLRPDSHISTWMQRHDDAVRATSEDCAMCHSFDYCQECHDGARLVGITGNVPDKLTPNAPQSWGLNNLLLSRNHDLNYRYTHALEAKSKVERCQLCHESETFCADCHQSVAGTGVGTPEWHGGLDWGANAVNARGAGGGRHAQLAKRDISMCASCHDANGEDPVCLLCHMDRTPGKNNDLRTHPRRYRSDHGPWHNDRNFMCFTCHVNANPADPAGFCSYCHAIR